MSHAKPKSPPSSPRPGSGEARPLRSFRIVAEDDLAGAVADLLETEGFRFEPEPFSPLCFRLVEEPFPLGSSLAALFGYVYIQDRSSMLPPLALAPRKGATVLDMCASPGSKTGFVAQLVGRDGFVLGNEVNRARLATLRANLRTLNMIQAGTCSFSGEDIPLPEGSLGNILLDPPCSGWGTVEKNPEVLVMWREGKVAPLVSLQRRLLARAAALLAPGGVVVYSTCTTNSDENERQVAWAENELGLRREPLPPFPGFVWDDREGSEGTLRVHGEKSGAQGFYIARLRKEGGATAACADGTAGRDARGTGQPFGSRCVPGSDTGPASDVRKPGQGSGRGKRGAGVPKTGCDVSVSSLSCATVDAARVPDGRCAVFSGTVRFLPRGALDLLPEGFVWQGAPLGRLQGGGFQADSRLRVLFPERGAESLVLETVAEVRALLSGARMDTSLRGPDAALWLGSLPLGRVGVRRGRVIASFQP